MTEFPETRESLLLRVRSSSDGAAWEQFTLIYRPVIYRLARRRGLQDADAQDLAQQVLMAVASAIGRWQKSHEEMRFRHWLRRIVRNAIINALSRQPFDRVSGGSTMLELLRERPDAEVDSAVEVEQEYRREIYLRAAAIVRGDVEPETWRAFEA